MISTNYTYYYLLFTKIILNAFQTRWDPKDMLHVNETQVEEQIIFMQ